MSLIQHDISDVLMKNILFGVQNNKQLRLQQEHHFLREEIALLTVDSKTKYLTSTAMPSVTYKEFFMTSFSFIFSNLHLVD